jgi:hypothetical protein
MIEAMVMLVHKDHIEGLGRHEFYVLPRMGDYIVANDPKGIGHAYRVVEVHHPIDPTSTAGDIYVVDAGDLVEHQIAMRKEARH